MAQCNTRGEYIQRVLMPLHVLFMHLKLPIHRWKRGLRYVSACMSYDVMIWKNMHITCSYSRFVSPEERITPYTHTYIHVRQYLFGLFLVYRNLCQAWKSFWAVFAIENREFFGRQHPNMRGARVSARVHMHVPSARK